MIDERVYVEIILVISDQDSITVLELERLFTTLTIDLNGILSGILIIRHKRGQLFITVVVKAALSVSDTDTLNGDSGCELSVLLTNIVIAFIQSVLNHSAHTGVLVDVSELGSRLKSSFLGLLFSLLGLLIK